jgi:amino acid transporter
MKRVLGLGDLLLIAAAAIGPAFSLATTYGPMVEAGGSATPLLLVVIALVMVAVALGYRRLGMRDPNAGSSYTWVADAFGSRAGAYAAWVLIVANVFAVVATSAPAGAYTLALLAPGVTPTPAANAAVGALWVLAAGALLWRGMAPTSRVANALAIAELAVLLACTLAAFAHPAIAGAVSTVPPPSFAGAAGALALGVWMLDGWEVSASTAEEANDAARAPGSGGLAGLVLTAFVIGLCMTAFARVGTPGGFAAHEGDALAYVGTQLGGPWRLALTLVILLSLAAALQATLIYLSRSIYAMGRAGMLPRAFGALDARAQPAFGVWSLTALGVACTLASGLSASIGAAFAFVLTGTSFFIGLLFLITAAAAVRTFARERGARVEGALLPAIGALALAAILAVSFASADVATRAFIVAAAVAGVPFAALAGRAGAVPLTE